MVMLKFVGATDCLGEAGAFIDRGDNTYGGKYVINPSGGLISKGHPLGATGEASHTCICGIIESFLSFQLPHACWSAMIFVYLSS